MYTNICTPTTGKL